MEQHLECHVVRSFDIPQFIRSRMAKETDIRRIDHDQSFRPPAPSLSSKGENCNETPSALANTLIINTTLSGRGRTRNKTLSQPKWLSMVVRLSINLL